MRFFSRRVILNKTIFKEKKYIHIDKLCNLSEVIPKIKDKNFILKHGFYPFLGNKIIFKKYSVEINEETQNHFKRKERPIKYASHIDSLIYQWYSYLLNKYYNNYALSRGFNTSSIAYRTCFPGKSSVDFAKEAIDFIKSTGSCYILVSDFSKISISAYNNTISIFSTYITNFSIRAQLVNINT